MTGVPADETVNVDSARQVGEQILNGMVGKSVVEYTFRKKDQAITLTDSSAMKTKEGMIQIEPQLLFRRLIMMGTCRKNLTEAFQYELCSCNPALFQNKSTPCLPNKVQLADAVWNLMPADIFIPPGDVQYVLDGGALLLRIIWNRGSTYNEICEQYVMSCM